MKYYSELTGELFNTIEENEESNTRPTGRYGISRRFEKRKKPKKQPIQKSQQLLRKQLMLGSTISTYLKSMVRKKPICRIVCLRD